MTGDDVLITEATRCLLGRDAPACEERPMVALKGKTEQVRLWAPIVPGITSVVTATAAERRSPA